MMATLALGTVQFGMGYGIANTSGRPGIDTVAAILDCARAAGARVLDTAIAYGEAEQVLGRIGLEGWQIVTKLPPLPEGQPDPAGWMRAQVEGSLSRLGVARLHGLLLHNPVQMHGPLAATLAAGLESLRAEGLAERVGVSIQHPDHDLPAVLAHLVPGLIQSPLNLLDRALVDHGWAARLRALGCEVHARSALLQGLLAMPAAQRPRFFAQWPGIWQAWDGWLARTGLDPAAACLRFVRAQPDVTACVVGAETLAQMQALVAAGDAPLPSLPDWPDPPDPDLITPSRWKTP